MGRLRDKWKALRHSDSPSTAEAVVPKPDVPVTAASQPPLQLVPTPSQVVSQPQPQPQSQPPFPSLLLAPVTALSLSETSSLVSVNNEECPSPPINPWDAAFASFEERDPDLADDFMKQLSSITTTDVDLSSPKSMKVLVESLEKKRKDKQWNVSLFGTNVQVREKAERLVKFVSWVEPVIKEALNNQPQAALAFSAVSILLPLLTSGTKENEAMMDGFNSINDVLIYWKAAEDVLQGHAAHTADNSFLDSLSKLYSNIIEYQATVICHLSRRQMKRAWRDVTGENEWGKKLEAVHSMHQKCKDLVGLSSQDRIQRVADSQLQAMTESTGILKELLQLQLAERANTKDEKQRKAESDLLQDLACPYDMYKDFNRQRVKGTCEWFFADERFQTWRDSQSSNILWVSAGPGCGKSVLSKALIDEGRLHASRPVAEDTVVCHFFFKADDDNRTHATNALCALLHKLFTKDATGSLIENALPSHKNFGEGLINNFSELWSILVQSARSDAAGEIVCILDALDECEPTSRKQLIDKLRQFYLEEQSAQKPSKLKFLLTSRPYDVIETEFGRFSNGNYVRFDGDGKAEVISREIDLVIDALVEEVADAFDEDDRAQLATRLKGMQNRTYLWLYLVFDVIRSSPSEFGRACDIEDLISTLPAEVADAYDHILSRSKSLDRTKIILSIVLAAREPPTLQWVNAALTMALMQRRKPTKASDVTKRLWPADKFPSIVKNLCGLFISVYDSKLAFIHQTAREFLLDLPPQGNSLRGTFTMPSAHTVLSSICISTLQLPTDPGLHRLYRYAVRQWHVHYSLQEPRAAEQSLQAARDLCRVKRHLDGWMARYDDQDDIMIAVHLGLDPIVTHILEHEKLPNFDRDVLEKAIRAGNVTLLRLLVGYKSGPWYAAAPSDEVFSIYEEALATAIQSDSLECVQVLLENDDDRTLLSTNALNDCLFNAVSRGLADVCRCLVEHGADVNSIVPGGEPPITEAAYQSNLEVAKVLMEYKAHQNPELDKKNGPLIGAAKHRNYKMAKLLLENGVNPNQRDVDNEHETALLWAAYYHDRRLVDLLLKYGADIEYQASNDETVIEAAARGSKDSLEMVQYLLGLGAPKDNPNLSYRIADVAPRDVLELLWVPGGEPDAVNRRGSTKLMLAAKNGNVDGVRFLIKHGANVNARSVQGRELAEVPAEVPAGETALMVASWGCEVEVMRVLLESHADPNLASSKGKTALMLAAMGDDSAKCVRLLLEYQADVRREDNEGSTAIDFAGPYGSPAMKLLQGAGKCGGDAEALKQFLARDAQDEAEPSVGVGDFVRHFQEVLLHFNPTPTNILWPESGTITPEHFRIIVQKMLDSGADLNTLDCLGRTVLMGAARRGWTDIVTDLLEHDADPNIQDREGRTALMEAAWARETKCVRRLIRYGASVSLCDQDGETALSRVVEYAGLNYRMRYHSEVGPTLDLLLEHGANINTQNNSGNTLLHAVALEMDIFRSAETLSAPMQKLFLNLAQHLLSRGADPMIKNKNEETALTIILQRGEQEDGEFARLLRSHMKT